MYFAHWPVVPNGCEYVCGGICAFLYRGSAVLCVSVLVMVIDQSFQQCRQRFWFQVGSDGVVTFGHLDISLICCLHEHSMSNGTAGCTLATWPARRMPCYGSYGTQCLSCKSSCCWLTAVQFEQIVPARLKLSSGSLKVLALRLSGAGLRTLYC